MDKLNNKQREAVLSDDKNILVIAGAGSGKTTVLSKRIKRIVEEGCATRDILAITFTNKAANEMRERIKSPGVLIKTFHSLGLLVIRQNLQYISYLNDDFSILDTQDQKRIIKHLFHKDKTYKPSEILAAIYYAKSKSLVKTDLYKNALESMQEYVLEYEKYTKKNNSIDFDDLLLLSNELLTNNQISNKYNFNHILIDEYQDTNSIQISLITKIKKHTTSTFYVGDVDQAIYGWRGADVNYILSLKNENYTIIKLEQNYRSTSKILEAANLLINNNESRYDKKLWTDKKGGSNVSFLNCEDKYEEMASIYRELEYNLAVNKTKTNAILYRFNYESKAVEELLVKNNVKYIMYNGIRFYERMEIKDSIAYIKLLINNSDNNSFLRIINTPKRKIGDITLQKINTNAEINNISFFESSKEINALKTFFATFTEYETKILDDFNTYAYNFLDAIGYIGFIKSYDENYEERIQNINELLESMNLAIENGQSLNEYLNELLLFENAENSDEANVILSTIHGVKGLEFDNVFLIDCNEGTLPSYKCMDDNEQLEEERRVVYVAITRARSKLFCSFLQRDYQFNSLRPSRFLYEMGYSKEKKENEFLIF